MEEEDGDSDEGKESDDGSDDTQENVHNKVADMIHNQQEYIQMCHSSAQLLQLLSRLVPGTAISGQMMKLENVTDDSEDSTAESDTASSSRSPATSDDNSGCVIWAEPIMTCELGPSWKPYCSDVRRLPQGVRPDDIKNKRQPGSGGLCDKVTPSCAAGNRLKYSGSRKDGVLQGGNAPTTSAQNVTRTGDCRKDNCSHPPVVESQRLEDGGSNIRVTPAVFNEAMSKILGAADTIKRARNILASVGAGRQANNNNNPEVSGNNSSLNPGAAKSGKRVTSDKLDATSTEINRAVEGSSGGSAQSKPTNRFLHLLNGSSTSTIFPPPILVKSAGAQEHDRPETKESADSTEKEPSVEVVESKPTNQSVSGLFRQNSYPSGHSSHSNRHLNLGQPEVLTQSNTSRCVRPSRVTGQLYRYPSSTSAILSSNRTQQLVSLGAAHTENRVLPPPVNLPVVRQSIKYRNFENLLLDFSVLDISHDGNKDNQRHTITLSNLRNALETALNHLKRQGAWKMCEDIVNTGQSVDTRNTGNIFTMTEVERLNNVPKHVEIDTQGSDAAQTVCNNVSCEATHTVEFKASENGTLSNANLTTEVENIFYFEHRSSKQSSMVAEGNSRQDELSSSDDERGSESIRRQSSTSSPQAHVISREISPGDNDESLEVLQRRQFLNSQRVYSHISSRKGCRGRLDSCRANTNGGMRNSPTAEAGTLNTKRKGVKKDEIKSMAASGDNRYTDSNMGDNSKETDRNRATQTCRVSSTEEIGANGLRRNLKCKVCNVKSTEERDYVHAADCSLDPRGALMDIGRNDLKCIKCSHEVIVPKGEDKLASTFHEAGDTVGILTKFNGQYQGQFNLNNQDVVRKECNLKPQTGDGNSRQNTSTTINVGATSGRRQCVESNEKSSWQKFSKTQADIIMRRLTTAFFDKENSKNAQNSEHDKVFDSSSMQLGILKVLNTEEATCNRDDVVEIKINQEEGLTNIVLEREVNQAGGEVVISQLCFHDSQNNANLHGDGFTANIVDFSAVHHIEGSSKQMPMSKRAIDDMQVDSIRQSGSDPVDTTCRKVRSSCLRKRFRRRSKCRSKVEFLNDNKSNEASESEHKEIASNNSLTSSNTHLTCQNMIPAIQLENTHSSTNIRVSFMNGLPSLEELASIKSECSHNQMFHGGLPKEMEDIHVNGQDSSAAMANGSLHSSRTSSFESVSLTTDGNMASELASGAAETASSGALTRDVETEEESTGGIKMRFLRLFSRCLHPFGNRN